MILNAIMIEAQDLKEGDIVEFNEMPYRCDTVPKIVDGEVIVRFTQPDLKYPAFIILTTDPDKKYAVQVPQ